MCSGCYAWRAYAAWLSHTEAHGGTRISWSRLMWVGHWVQVDGTTHTCSTAPKLGSNVWTPQPGVVVTARCTRTPGPGVAGIAMATTLTNTTAQASSGFVV